jgi:hypothetical protein
MAVAYASLDVRPAVREDRCVEIAAASPCWVRGRWMPATFAVALRLGNDQSPVDSYDAPVLRYITIAIWGLSSLFATLGLLYSLVSVEEVPPPAEPSSDAG